MSRLIKMETPLLKSPVSVFDAEMEVTADTVVMSEPHEIDYTLNFDSTTAKEAEKTAK